MKDCKRDQYKSHKSFANQGFPLDIEAEMLPEFSHFAMVGLPVTSWSLLHMWTSQQRWEGTGILAHLLLRLAPEKQCLVQLYSGTNTCDDVTNELSFATTFVIDFCSLYRLIIAPYCQVKQY